ncbi:hypothetical protein [Edwardsiella ictaluri]|uniref:Uncharacterized protein n=2 Tax=Edwardsiella ictaluri TaxID=67780 RepID=C5BEP7_EDWI9|nr:hypothetical protein [Edwardsiella ictaluri]ACR70285.1 hypothetical protein NT01EI_3135 [Edwardsiella ictaluri 93-146]EKS7762484.1 hypothetical protein [Edwardsiella ictaluri]EKS7770434.1 hypothetical protein [Edwardsiella ictaluri]EKS7773576.1 hypothetical protein [Edwardsiella ictaluri]EKS7776099.1 hypothetical protein [Edwardsiella ictaluri]
MKKIYIHKDNLDSYTEYPVPEDTTDWYTVDVPDDFTLAGSVYNPQIGEFDTPALPPI